MILIWKFPTYKNLCWCLGSACCCCTFDNSDFIVAVAVVVAAFLNFECVDFVSFAAGIDVAAVNASCSFVWPGLFYKILRFSWRRSTFLF